MYRIGTSVSTCQPLLHSLKTSPACTRLYSACSRSLTALARDFERQGYCVLPAFLHPEQVTDMRERTEELLDEFAQEPERYDVVFDTSGQSHMDDPRFLATATTISPFLREGGTIERFRESIDKIGHNVKLDPVFGSAFQKPKLLDLLSCLGMPNPLWVQTMINLKLAGAGPLPAHRDATWLSTEPPRGVIASWIALGNVTKDNGCLVVWPGSHHMPLHARHERGPDGKMVWRDYYKASWKLSEGKPLEVPAGTLVCFSDHLVHGSLANTTQISRPVLVGHAYDKSYEFPDNWLPGISSNF